MPHMLSGPLALLCHVCNLPSAWEKPATNPLALIVLSVEKCTCSTLEDERNFVGDSVPQYVPIMVPFLSAPSNTFNSIM